MKNKHIPCLMAVFFYSVGWVCSSPAIGQSSEGGGDSAVSTTTTDEGMFADGDAGSDNDIPEGQSIEVGAFGQMSLHINDLDVTKVLQLLSIQFERNIVASRNVSGTVAADLHEVDFYQALDAILHPNGFGYEEVGDFIYVYTAEELKAREEAKRTTEVRIVHLDYISAVEASTFVQNMLSGAGSIVANGEAAKGFKPSESDAGAFSRAHGEMLIIKDYPENLDEISRVIGEMDVRPKQVLIEATVLEVRLDEANAWGVDLSILIDYDFTQFTGTPLNIVDGIISGNVTDTGGGTSSSSFVQALGEGGGIHTNVGRTANGDAGVKFGIMTENVAAFVRALDRVTDTTVVAKPKLLVLNRQRAELLVGAKLGYISTTATETSTTQTVEFLDVGTSLVVRPFVSRDDTIRMEIKPSVSDGSTAAVGNFVIPNETTNELTSNVMVSSGQTLVLGGLFKEDTTVTREQVPFFGDVPILGAAFKGQDDGTERSEVIFMVTPTVIKEDIMTKEADKLDGYIETVRFGAREGLLPWSREKMTVGHLRDAMKLEAKGDRPSALWHVNMALSMDPRFVDARNFKSTLMAPNATYVDRHMLSSTTDAVVEESLRAAEEAAARNAAEVAAQPVTDDEAMDDAAEDAPLMDEADEAEVNAADAEAAAPAVVEEAPLEQANADEVEAFEPAEEFVEEEADMAVETVEPAVESDGIDLSGLEADPSDADQVATVETDSEIEFVAADNAGESVEDHTPTTADESGEGLASVLDTISQWAAPEE